MIQVDKREEEYIKIHKKELEILNINIKRNIYILNKSNSKFLMFSLIITK